MSDLEELFKVIDEIKHSERQGWKDIGVDRPRDTIASHSLGASITGWILSEKEGLNSEKVVKMLLIHDLIMAYIPDYTPEDEEYESKQEFERQKLEELYETVPEEISSEFKSLLEELRERKTKEAQIAKEADKLDTLMQASSYNKETDGDTLKQFLETYSDYFQTETGQEKYSEIKDKSEN
jgi:putative hydrolase of HD superfamily